jgi:NADPH2:quinone reductase
MIRAVVVRAFGDRRAISVEALPEPALDDDGVRIGVQASGLSFANLLAIEGRHQNRSELPFVPGTDVSGTVLECGRAVTRFRPGDRVAAGLRRGGFADQVVVPQRTVFALPDAVGWDEAVQFPVMYGTAYGGLAWRARVAPGETVVVHGAAGGSGMAAVEVARALGARVIATAGGPEKADAVRRLGADIVVDHRERPFREVVLAATGGRGADVVFDPVGGSVFDESMRCIAPDGRLVVVGFASGTIPDVPANLALVKNFDLIGLYWGHYLGWGRLPSPARDDERVRAAMDTLFGWHREGRLRPVTHACYALEAFAEALDAQASRRTIGRIVLHPIERTSGGSTPTGDQR